MFLLVFLFLWFCAGLVLYYKYRLIVNGHKLKGEIVGFLKASESTLSFSGYNYVIRFKYDGKMHAAKSLQSKMGTIKRPPPNKQGKFCTIYYNPKYPEQVTMTGTYGMEIAAGLLFALGLLGIIMFFIN